MEAIEYGLYAVLAVSILIPPLSLITGRTSRTLQAVAWIAVILFGLVSVETLQKAPITLYNGLILHDGFTATIALAMSLAAALAMLAAGREPSFWESAPAFYSLLPLALFGSYFMLGATDALIVLATWLLVSVISYVVVALPSDEKSRAAAVQYIIIGAVATLFLAIWVAGDYLLASQQALSTFTITQLTIDKLSGVILVSLLAALGFKTGIAPFHWWLPSVYSKANGYVVSVVSGVIKLAFVGIMARIIYTAASNPIVSPLIAAILAILAVATMTYGNIAALTTRNLQKILAYSSIAHVGYILTGMAALAFAAPRDPVLASLAFTAIAVHLTAYGVSKAALFPLNVPESSLDRLKGLLSGNRIAAVSGAILLLSLLGLPPLLGFWGKLYLFLAAASYSIILVIAALINSAISSAYYVRAIRELVSSETTTVKPTDYTVAALAIAAAATLILGLIAPLYIPIISP